MRVAGCDRSEGTGHMGSQLLLCSSLRRRRETGLCGGVFVNSHVFDMGEMTSTYLLQCVSLMRR